MPYAHARPPRGCDVTGGRSHACGWLAGVWERAGLRSHYAQAPPTMDLDIVLGWSLFIKVGSLTKSHYNPPPNFYFHHPSFFMECNFPRTILKVTWKHQICGFVDPKRDKTLIFVLTRLGQRDALEQTRIDGGTVASWLSAANSRRNMVTFSGYQNKISSRPILDNFHREGQEGWVGRGDGRGGGDAGKWNR